MNDLLPHAWAAQPFAEEFKPFGEQQEQGDPEQAHQPGKHRRPQPCRAEGLAEHRAEELSSQ